MGALFSFIIMFVLIAFFYYKVDVMLERKRVDILSAVNENYYDENYIFGDEQGLNIGIAVVNVDDYNRPIDPTYGRI